MATNNNQNNQPEESTTVKPKGENTAEVTTTSKQTKQELENEPVIKNKEKQLETDNQAVNSSTAAEDYALSVVQSLDQRRIDVDRLEIKVNGEPVFAMKDGNIDRDKTEINDKQAELLKQALKDPTSFEGSVRITQGNKVLLHVENGRVITDSVGLTKESAKVEVESPESVNQGLYERYSQGVNQPGLAGSQKIAQNALEDGLERKQVIEMMKNHDPEYKKLADQSGDKMAQRTVVSEAEVNLAMRSQSQTEQQSQSQTASKSRSRSR